MFSSLSRRLASRTPALPLLNRHTACSIPRYSFHSSSSFSSSRSFSSVSAAAFLAVSGFAVYLLHDPSMSAANEAKWNPQSFTPLQLLEVRQYNENSKLFVFDLGGAEKSDPAVSHFILTKFKGEDGKDIIRPYTPLDASTYSQGKLQLLVKVYPGGKMSGHLFSLKPGDSVEVKGPMPKLKYESNKYQKVGMIAGGTGIAPMLQVLEKGLNDQSDRTQFSLLFGNVSPKDILLKERLDELQRKYPERFQVHYLVDKPADGWKGDVGYVTPELVKKYLPAPGASSFIYVCGPPPMYKAVSGPKAPDFTQGELSGVLAELGYKSENVFKF